MQVIDMLLFKGTEELKNVVDHAKQRHHIIGQYVVGRQGLVHDSGTKDQGISPFLKNFYSSNYFWSLIMSCSLFAPTQIKSYLWLFCMSIPDKDNTFAFGSNCCIHYSWLNLRKWCFADCCALVHAANKIVVYYYLTLLQTVKVLPSEYIGTAC